MSTFEVWAPGRRQVDVLVMGDDAGEGTRVAMTAAPGGWWQVEVPSAGPGTRYLYSLDGGPGRPDPRSAWQPQGIDGPSALVDHGSFEWHDSAWRGFGFEKAVLYELHVGTFSAEGTFEGGISHLGHLSNMGLNAVELMPVAEASGLRGWGYDGVGLWAPHHGYGGPEGLKRLVDACHQRGLAVVLDVVYNHLGPVGNYLSEFGPYFTDRYKTPWGWAVNFDGPGSHEVRNFVVSNALMWLRDYHFDGLRLDAVHSVFDESALHILEELSRAVSRLSLELGRELWLIAESDRNDPKLVRARSSHGYGLSACWDDDFHHALHAVMTGERDGYYSDFGQLGQLGKAIRHVYVYDGQFSPFRQHVQGRPAGALPRSRFVGYLQNHDQVGNRLFGERISALVGHDMLRAGLAVVLLGPLVPMLFQGEEWGASTPFLYFTDHSDPSLGAAVSEGRLREHPLPPGAALADVPDPQEEASFLRCKLDWSEQEREPHRSLLAWCRALIALRRERPGLTGGEGKAVEVGYDEQLGWLVFRRSRYCTAVNFSDRRREVPLLGGPGCFFVLLSSDEAVVPGAQLAGPLVELAARSAAVVEDLG